MLDLDRQRRMLALATSALAGFVDAVGFASAGRYFLSFMSGNTTRLGVNLVADPALALTPAALVAGFVMGVVAGALIAERSGGRRKTGVLALCAILLMAAALLYHVWQAGFLAASVAAMGALNNVFRRNGDVALGLTYMTGALVRFGQGLAAAILRHPGQGRLGAGGLWLALAAGAICGAAAFAVWPVAVPWIAAALCLGLLSAAWIIERGNPSTRG